MEMEMNQYALNAQEELKQLIRDLCAIPAPSHHEEKRAAFCRDWFLAAGGADTYIDAALNVVCPYGDDGKKPLIALTAHTDTVFPDLTPLPFREEGKIMYCPGVTDDTAQLAVLMLAAKYVLQNGLPAGSGLAAPSGEPAGSQAPAFLFVANSCEEGLGNLKGLRELVKNYGDRLIAHVSLDGSDLTGIVNRAVGSHRYRVRVKTAGGHSFGNFGRPNAIHALAKLITRLYDCELPQEGESRTTYNVGVISGGTSVNTIAQSAEMLFEYRSDNRACLEKMQDFFRDTVRDFAQEYETEVELVGDRPCSASADGHFREKQEELEKLAQAAILEVTGQEAEFGSGSTDSNIPLSVGIPSLTMGACVGSGCHTREEWLDTESLADGLKLALALIRRLAGF